MTFIQSQYQTDENRDLGKHIFKRWQNYIISRPYIIKNSRKNTKKFSIILVHTFITSQTVKGVFQKYLGLINDVKITFNDQ